MSTSQFFNEFKINTLGKFTFRTTNTANAPTKTNKSKKKPKPKHLEPSPKWKSVGLGNNSIEKEMYVCCIIKSGEHHFTH